MSASVPRFLSRRCRWRTDGAEPSDERRRLSPALSQRTSHPASRLPCTFSFWFFGPDEADNGRTASPIENEGVKRVLLTLFFFLFLFFCRCCCCLLRASRRSSRITTRTLREVSERSPCPTLTPPPPPAPDQTLTQGITFLGSVFVYVVNVTQAQTGAARRAFARFVQVTTIQFNSAKCLVSNHRYI